MSENSNIYLNLFISPTILESLCAHTISEKEAFTKLLHKLGRKLKHHVRNFK